MIVYRITREKYHKDISGTGAKVYGGRWNPKGTSVLYISETRALSTLEYLVHTDYDLEPPRLKIISIELPIETTELSKIAINELPENWRRSPPPGELKVIGESRLIQEDRLAIKVPSVVIPKEYNIVVNTAHRDFENVQITLIEDYKIDIRLIRKE